MLLAAGRTVPPYPAFLDAVYAVRRPDAKGIQRAFDRCVACRRPVVDRENKRYVERVMVPDGSIVRDVDEPLDEHLGRGSDKPRTRRRNPR